MLDLPPFDRVLNTLQCDVHCGHPMRRQPVISEFKVAILKKCPMNPGFTLVRNFMGCSMLGDITVLRSVIDIGECHCVLM